MEQQPPARKNGLTKVERYFSHTLNCPLDSVRFCYESNGLEHLPSRLLSLAPHPLATLIGLCISSFADSLATAAPQTGAPTTAVPAAGDGVSDAPLTEQVAQSFADAQSLTPASVLQCCKSSRKRVKAIYELLPDQELASNVYSTANVPEGVETDTGSFILASEQSSQSCLYQAETDNLPEGVVLGPSDTYGVPTAMFNYQHSASQAPKRWLVLRKAPGDNVGYISEMGGRRIALSLDREFSIESNSSIYLKADVKKRRVD